MSHHDISQSSTLSRPLLQVWAVDISGYGSPSQSSSTNATLDETVKYLLDEAGPQGSGKSEAIKVMKYVREVDRKRALISKLLPRLMFTIHYKECSWSNMIFETTREGRPFLAHPVLKNIVDFNLTHDASWVILAFHLPSCGSSSSTPAVSPRAASLVPSPSVALGSPIDRAISFSSDRHVVRVGIDVMRISLPHFEESSRSFAETMETTLTSEERAWVLAPYDNSDTAQSFGKPKEQGRDPMQLDSKEGRKSLETLSRLYDLWTHKEAFTKNIGRGLGFDFTRIQLEFWRCENLANLGSAADQKKAVSTSRDGVHGSSRATEDQGWKEDLKFPMQLYRFQDPTASERFALERGSRASGTKTTSNEDASILKILGTSEPLYDFTEIILPDGQIEDDSQGKINLCEKMGRTCVASQCVVAEGPILEDRKGVARREQVQKALSAKEAVEKGLMRIWKMEEIIERAQQVRSGEVRSDRNFTSSHHLPSNIV